MRKNDKKKERHTYHIKIAKTQNYNFCDTKSLEIHFSERKKINT